MSFQPIMFELIAKEGEARCGKLRTKSGVVETPFFMPVATKGTVKFLTPDDLKSLDNQAVISNAFILYLRPGLDVLKKGIKHFMQYHGVNVTDSGGFQMYTESFLKKVTDEYVVFESPFDGTKHKVTPEKNMEIQVAIDGDVAMCLDVMPNFHGVEREEIAEAVRRTTLWAKRCKEAHDKLNTKQLLFGISQGGIHADLREQSVKELLSLDFDGYACGGLGMGEPVEERYKAVTLQRSLLSDDKVLYLMGIGSPVELIEAVALGADMFDSRFPTQNARRGTIFTSAGKLRIKRKEYEADEKPLDEHCDCFVCKTYSRAYLRHLLVQEEGSGYRLVTYHQLYYVMQLMKNIRKSIKEGTFAKLRKQILDVYKE